jgi:hypothetical protein
VIIHSKLMYRELSRYQVFWNVTSRKMITFVSAHVTAPLVLAAGTAMRQVFTDASYLSLIAFVHTCDDRLAAEAAGGESPPLPGLAFSQNIALPSSQAEIYLSSN